MSGRLDGKVIVVTGGASGIGAAICRRAAAEGAALAILDVQYEPARALADELEGAARAWAADVTD
jgi:meso-butanediol dehydrogenase/(S,S)-butanediol dehydrogenase/diacetyl reductase